MMISTISEAHTKKLGLKIKTLDRFLDIEGTGGGWVPYNSYVEVQLDISGIAAFKEDVLILVTDDRIDISTHACGYRDFAYLLGIRSSDQ